VSDSTAWAAYSLADTVQTMSNDALYIQKQWQITCLSCGHGSTGFYKINATFATERVVCSTYHAFVRNLVRERSHSLVRPRGTDIRDETCTAAFKRKLKTFLLFSGVWLHMILFYWTWT